MGVVSGIVMPFQIGTNWSRFSDTTANVLAPLLAYEGLTAFFLEASFLGVLLFGRKLVPPWVHFFAGLMVAAGTLFSTFWILSVNSWMQTPAGFRIEDGRFFPDNWWAVIFNPSFPYRYVHNVTAFYITTAFVVLGVGAWLLRRERSTAEARVMIDMALNLLIILVPVQMILGDLHGQNTLQFQPAKLAAIEGLYETASPAPLTLFGIPDDAAGTMRDAIAVPVLGSIVLTHSRTGEIKGLNSFPPDQRPPVAVPFFGFRVMVGIALIMLCVAIAGQFLRLEKRLDQTVWFLRLCECTAPLGFVAVLAGWMTTEVGRQPWTVYGLLRTAQSVTPSLTGFDVAISLGLYIVVYLIMFPTGIGFMAGIVRRGCEDIGNVASPIEAGLAAAPFLKQAGE
jgi:cytochrome d ubiquinol oxidase subunit I